MDLQERLERIATRFLAVAGRMEELRRQERAAAAAIEQARAALAKAEQRRDRAGPEVVERARDRLAKAERRLAEVQAKVRQRLAELEAEKQRLAQEAERLGAA